MLRIYHSNRLEALLERLGAVLAEPLPLVLEPELMVTQNRGMARWLSLNLATDVHLGVAANIRFVLPAELVWEVFRSQLEGVPRSPQYHREGLTWRCMEILPGLLQEPEFGELRRYLADDRGGTKVYQLCRRIGDVFDQYLIYRPDMILGWEAGAEQGWQPRLWRALSAAIETPHRAALWQQLRLRQGTHGLDPATLPQRVCVFGISALAPAYLEVLARLGAVLDTHLFVLNPSLGYWGDIVPERDQARIRALRSDLDSAATAVAFDVGNPLLASLGKQGREFQAQIHADALGGFRLADEQRSDIACFVPPLRQDAAADRRLDLLRTLQLDILMLQDRGSGDEPPLMPLEPDDRSLQVHVCHSRMREIEVLHDQLLALFDAPPGSEPLDPREIVVMAPAIDDYADCIKAVFGGAPESRRIPWSIADRGAGAEHPLVQLFLRLLALPAGRFSATEVLSILEVPAVSRRFALVGEAFDLIRGWISESGIRWGYDARTRAELGLPEWPENTWKQGLQSMLLGYAMAEDAAPFKGIQPWGHFEGSEAEILGRLHSFVDVLEAARRELTEPRPVGDWCAFLAGLVEALLEPQADEEPALQIIGRALADFAECAADASYRGLLSVDVVAEYLTEALAGPSRYQAYLNGCVTFCSMIPMRSIPFRVVCLLGMNDGDYPRQRLRPSFDLIANGPPCLGDRSRRDDDRYLFLEALLSARDVFYLSYVGRGIRDNAPLLPAGVVGELLTQVERGFVVTAMDPRRPAGVEALRRQVVTEHRLQPFCGAYFEPGGALFSYATEWLPKQAAGSAAVSGQAAFFPRALTPAPGAGVVELEELVRFFRSPARYLLAGRLNLQLESGPDSLQDSEAFALSALQVYRVRDELLRYCLDRGIASDGVDGDVLLMGLRARGVLPVGPFAEVAMEKIVVDIQELLRSLEDYEVPALEPVDEPLGLGDAVLRVKLDSLNERGLLEYRPGRIRHQDRISAWIRHLALNAVVPPGCECRTRFVGIEKGKIGTFTLIPVSEPEQVLERLLTLFERGQSCPLPYLPESSWAYAAARVNGKSETEAERAARLEWRPSWGAGEADDAYLRTAFRGSDPLDGAFRELALAVAAPALAHVVDVPDPRPRRDA